MSRCRGYQRQNNLKNYRCRWQPRSIASVRLLDGEGCRLFVKKIGRVPEGPSGKLLADQLAGCFSGASVQAIAYFVVADAPAESPRDLARKSASSAIVVCGDAACSPMAFLRQAR